MDSGKPGIGKDRCRGRERRTLSGGPWSGNAGVDLYEADLALIRPDQHVAWRGGSADAAATLARTTGHL